jgi:O-antigen ligase
LGLSIPISTALDNTLVMILLLSWIVAGGWQERARVLASNPPALAALVLFAVKTLGLAWSDAPAANALVYYSKYDDLLLPAILVTLMLDAEDCRRALLALAAGVALTLLLSYGIKLHLVPPAGFITGTADNPTVFRKYISQSVVVAFGCLLFALLALREKRRAWRAVWWALAALAAFNVLYLVHGRTGYLVLAVVALLLLSKVWGWRGTVAAVLALGAAFFAGYQLSTSLHLRVEQAVTEVRNWQPDQRSQGGVAERLEFYHNTLKIIREHPWFGVGTGDFEIAYAKQVQGTDMPVTRNPHNQYLMTTAQTGLLGLAALLALFAVQLRCAGRLPSQDLRMLAYGIVLSTAAGSLVNSMLMDHMESLLFGWCSGLLFSALPRGEARQEA